MTTGNPPTNEHQEAGNGSRGMFGRTVDWLTAHEQSIWIALLALSLATLASGVYLGVSRNALPDDMKALLAWVGALSTSGLVWFISFISLKDRLESTVLGVVRAVLGRRTGVTTCIVVFLGAGIWLHVAATHTIPVTVLCKAEKPDKSSAQVVVRPTKRFLDVKCNDTTYLPKGENLVGAAPGFVTEEHAADSNLVTFDLKLVRSARWTCRLKSSFAETEFGGCGASPTGTPWELYSTYTLEVRASNGAVTQGSRFAVYSTDRQRVGVLLRQLRPKCRVDAFDPQRDTGKDGMTFESGCALADDDESSTIEVRVTICEPAPGSRLKLDQLARFELEESGHGEATKLRCLE